MKKIVFLLFTVVTTTGLLAQKETSGFEGGKIMPSFRKVMDHYQAKPINGKLIGYQDTEENVLITGHTLSVGEGLSLVWTLIKAPALLNVVKDRPNMIRTNKFIFLIVWGNNEWNLLSQDKNLIAEKGARVFFLENKNN